MVRFYVSCIFFCLFVCKMGYFQVSWIVFASFYYFNLQCFFCMNNCVILVKICTSKLELKMKNKFESTCKIYNGIKLFLYVACTMKIFKILNLDEICLQMSCKSTYVSFMLVRAVLEYTNFILFVHLFLIYISIFQMRTQHNSALMIIRYNPLYSLTNRKVCCPT